MQILCFLFHSHLLISLKTFQAFFGLILLTIQFCFIKKKICFYFQTFFPTSRSCTRACPSWACSCCCSAPRWASPDSSPSSAIWSQSRTLPGRYLGSGWLVRKMVVQKTLVQNSLDQIALVQKKHSLG